MLGMGLDGWTNLMIGSLAIAAFAAVLSWASTFVVTRLQKQEEKAAGAELKRYQDGVAGQVAEAKREGIQAGKTAGDAMVRAAELEKEAAIARLETEKVKAAVAWRVIPPESAQTMEKLLSEKTGAVNLRYIDGDTESQYLAMQIARILVNAHWVYAPGGIKPANSIQLGIVLPPSTSADAESLAAALSGANVKFSRHDVQVGATFNVGTIEGAPMLIVGSKDPRPTGQLQESKAQDAQKHGGNGEHGISSPGQ